MQRTRGLSLWHVDGLPVVVLCCFSVVLDRLGRVELKNVGFLHGGGTKVCNRHWVVYLSNENSKDSFHQTCCHGIDLNQTLSDKGEATGTMAYKGHLVVNL